MLKYNHIHITSFEQLIPTFISRKFRQKFLAPKQQTSGGHWPPSLLRRVSAWTAAAALLRSQSHPVGFQRAWGGRLSRGRLGPGCLTKKWES